MIIDGIRYSINHSQWKSKTVFRIIGCIIQSIVSIHSSLPIGASRRVRNTWAVLSGHMDMEVVESCRRAVETGRLDREDCIRMLGYDADSEESRFIIDTADRVMRERNGNSCSIGGRSVSSQAPASRTAVSADSRLAPRERMIT